MAFNNFGTMFNRQPSEMNFGNGFNMRPKRNPFRALSFEQEPIEEQQSFIEAYPRERMSDYEKFLMQEKPQFERSKGAKIAAALIAGIGGYAGNPNALRESNAALRAPYEREMEEYEMEGGRLKELSSIETARINQDRASRKAIQDYELAKADDVRQDRALVNTERLGENTLETGKVTRDNLRSQIDNRGKSLQRNEITGELELVDQNTMSRASLGSFAPSYGQKQTDTNTEWDRRAGVTNRNQRSNAAFSSGLARSNMFAGKQFDLDNPSPSSGIIPPNQQRDAEEMADEELLYGPNSKYRQLVEEVPAATAANPNATGLRKRDLSTIGVVEGQILQDLMKEYEREKAIRMNEILNKPRGGRFEISPIK